MLQYMYIQTCLALNISDPQLNIGNDSTQSKTITEGNTCGVVVLILVLLSFQHTDFSKHRAFSMHLCVNTLSTQDDYYFQPSKINVYLFALGSNN